MEITVMKKPFKAPELEIEKSAVADIVTESGEFDDMNGYTPWH